ARVRCACTVGRDRAQYLFRKDRSRRPICHAECKDLKTSSLISEVRMRIKSSAALVANTSPPDLVLNRHCGQCEFQGRCHKQTREKDELSLLGGMSDKERKKL